MRAVRVLAVVTAVAVSAIVVAPAAPAAGAAQTTAVVVIDTGAGVRSALVEVGGGTSGLAALQKVAAVTTYGFGGLGAAVCAIDGVGNAAGPSCLIGPHGEYWAYFHVTGGSGAWAYSPAGAGSTTVHGGDVEGWRYGTGQKPGASASFCDYTACAPPPADTTAPIPAATAAPSGSGNAGGGGAPGGGAGVAPTARTGNDPPGTASSDDSGPAASSASPSSDPTTTVPAPATGGAAPPGKPAGLRVEASGSRAGPDGGSPVGVAVAGGLLALLAGGAVWLRRRSRVPG
jgi:hypothetical protein